MSRSCHSLLVLVFALLTPAIAQELETHPGFFPLDSIGGLTSDDVSLEVNLQGAMLELVALATAEDDPELSQLVSGLRAIRVRIAPVARIDLAAMRSSFPNAARRLEETGWRAMLRAREEDEEIYMFAREVKGEILGLTLLAFDEEEVVLLNLVGELDLARLGSLARGLDLPLLDQATGSNERRQVTE